MQTLRQARLLARLILAWFVLALGVAVAAPVVSPKSFDLVCSAGGAMKLVVQGEDGTTVAGTHTLDCPLCGATGAAPPSTAWQPAPPSPLAFALQRDVAAHLRALTAAPLSARAPPARS